MQIYRYYTCDVFTDRTFGGNPLAVLTDARGLSDATMQAIAREFNYSETAFVISPSDPRHTARLRIFTPGGELPFAGHPTVGAAFVLASIGATPGATEIVLEEGVGPVRVRIERNSGLAVGCTLTAARLPERVALAPAASRLGPMLGLTAGDIAERGEVWSCGVPFCVIPLTSVSALQQARIDANRWARVLGRHVGREVYPIAREDATTWRVRMFAPGFGIAEDAATGAAAAALAGWLVEHDRADGTRRWRILQGEQIGRPSEIALEADVVSATPVAVRVGGRCVMVAEGQLRL